MGDEGVVASAEHEGWKIESNSSTSKEILESVSEKTDETDEKTDEEKRSEAASELGKAGGKASAEKRAKETKDAEKKAKAEDKADQKPPPEKEKPGEAEDDEEKADEDKPLGKPRHDLRARMQEATRKEAEAKRERDQIRAEHDDLKARFEALQRGDKSEAKGAEDKTDAKPKVGDFGDFEEYLDARDQFNKRQWATEWSEEERRRSTITEQGRAFQQKETAFRDAIKKAGIEIKEEGVALLRPEWWLGPGEVPTAENWIANELIFSSERAPTLMLHFQEHPDELQRIAALSTPRDVSRAMASLETRLDAAAQTESSSKQDPPEKSKAAPPVKSLPGGPYVAEGEEYREGMSFGEYYKRNRKEFNLPR